MSIVYRAPNTSQEYENYFKFRWELLRKPLELPQGSEQDDLEDTAHHIAAYNDENIIGVGRLHIEDHFTSRIRYMAVDANSRNQGIGSKILSELEAIAYRQNIKTCWLLAREDVVPFYLKNNYEINGVADSELAIPHQRMQKKLTHD